MKLEPSISRGCTHSCSGKDALLVRGLQIGYGAQGGMREDLQEPAMVLHSRPLPMQQCLCSAKFAVCQAVMPLLVAVNAERTKAPVRPAAAQHKGCLAAGIVTSGHMLTAPVKPSI